MKGEIKENVATSVSVEFFTGYHFISTSSKDFWYSSHRDHNVILHVSKVRKKVGVGTFRVVKVSNIQNCDFTFVKYCK